MKPTPQEVLDAVSSHYGVPIEDIKGMNRYARIRDARHMYLYVAYRITGVSMYGITKLVNRDHSTLCHVVKKYNGFMTAEEDYNFNQLCRLFEGKETKASLTVQMYNNLGRHYQNLNRRDFRSRLAALNPLNNQRTVLKINQ
jgi:hypothetical protein